MSEQTITTYNAVVIIPKEEYDRLVAAANAIPVIEHLTRFRAADTTWGLRSVERRATIDEWDEVIITGTRPVRGFKNYGGSTWDEGTDSE